MFRDKKAYREIEQVQVFADTEPGAHPTHFEASDIDEPKIRRIADRLHHHGYGVRRDEYKTVGTTEHRLRAHWPGPGDPPADPLG